MDKAIVLVVEDEPLIRMNAALMVEEAGYAVIEATNADEAIRILEERNDINVVFTDVNMPGSMDGLKLAHAIHGRWPPIRVIVTSGQVAVRESDIREDDRFIAKPYDARQIANMLHDIAA